MAVMVLSAIVGVFAAISFITVNWSGPPRRAVIATILFSTLTFLAAASTSLLSAAKDTYAHRSDTTRGGDGDA